MRGCLHYRSRGRETRGLLRRLESELQQLERALNQEGETSSNTHEEKSTQVEVLLVPAGQNPIHGHSYQRRGSVRRDFSP
jgi:uncharacterized protein YlxW (UPF0749 family)